MKNRSEFNPEEKKIAVSPDGILAAFKQKGKFYFAPDPDSNKWSIFRINEKNEGVDGIYIKITILIGNEERNAVYFFDYETKAIRLVQEEKKPLESSRNQRVNQEPEESNTEPISKIKKWVRRIMGAALIAAIINGLFDIRCNDDDLSKKDKSVAAKIVKNRTNAQHE